MAEKQYTIYEDKLNSLTHGLGVVLGSIAGVFLIHKASNFQSPIPLIGVFIYLIGMLASFSVSTLYHASSTNYRVVLRKFDHAAIYLHIACTYTPIIFMTIWNDSYWGRSILSFVWIAAIAGIIKSFVGLKKHSYIETVCFVLMSSSIIIAIQPLWEFLKVHDNLAVLWWILAGGVSGISGAVFYTLYKATFTHTIFHVFILLNAFCNIMTIWYCLDSFS